MATRARAMTLIARSRHVSYSSNITDSVLFPTSDFKKQLNLPTTGTDDDTFLVGAISAARQFVERYIPGGFAVRLQTKELLLNKFPSSEDGEIELPFANYNSIESISFYDANNNSTSLASTDYRVIADGDGGLARLYPNVDEVWPTTRSRQDAVTIRFLCGSTAYADVSPTITHAMKMLVTHWYLNRSALITGTISKELEFGVNALLAANGYGYYG